MQCNTALHAHYDSICSTHSHSPPPQGKWVTQCYTMSHIIWLYMHSFSQWNTMEHSSNLVCETVLPLPHVVHTLLVQTVVGKMHAEVVQFLSCSCVLHRGKSGQALLKEVDTQRWVGGHSNVQPHIKLKIYTSNTQRGKYTAHVI